MGIISVGDLATHLGIGDTIDNTTLTAAVNAANDAVAHWCGREFDKTAKNSETTRVFRAASPWHAVVDDFWDTTNLTVKTDDTDSGNYSTTWTLTTDYVLQPLNGLTNGRTVPWYQLIAVGTRTFPVGVRAGVQVKAAWGWAATPGPVFQATLVKAARLFKRKDSPEGVLGGFADFTAIRISSREDPDVAALLAPYRRPETVALVG